VKKQQLTKRITREIQRSPAKAGVLGVLLLVAVWFWFPLVKGWVIPKSTASKKSDVVPTVTQKATGPGPLVQQPMSNPSIPWQQVAEQIAADPHTAPISLQDLRRDPFYQKVVQEELVVSVAENRPRPQMVEPSPEQAGLMVQSVITRGTTGLARINQQNYRVGDIVVAPEQIAEYEITAIESWGVRLSRNGKSYDLALDERIESLPQRWVIRDGHLISSEK